MLWIGTDFTRTGRWSRWRWPHQVPRMTQQKSAHWMSYKAFGTHKVSPSSLQDYQLSCPKIPCGGLSFGVLSVEKWRSSLCALFTRQFVFSGGSALPIPETLHKERLYRVVLPTNNWSNGERGWSWLPKSLSFWCWSFLGMCGFQAHLYSSEPAVVQECRISH